jgi:large subunit ribosomal protein L18
MGLNKKEKGRIARKSRIRKSIEGTSERPRLSVFRSTKYIYAQIVDDVGQATLASCSSNEKLFKGKLKSLRNLDAAKEVGKQLADRAKQKKIQQVVFDRNGYVYHGRVKALADSAREAGLNF